MWVRMVNNTRANAVSFQLHSSHEGGPRPQCTRAQDLVSRSEKTRTSWREAGTKTLCFGLENQLEVIGFPLPLATVGSSSRQHTKCSVRTPWTGAGFRGRPVLRPRDTTEVSSWAQQALSPGPRDLTLVAWPLLWSG